MNPCEYSIQRLNENSLLLSFSQTISTATSETIRQFNYSLCQTLTTYILDTVPSYTTLMIVFDDDKINCANFLIELQSVSLDANKNTNLPHIKKHRIPVLYDSIMGLDLAIMADQKGLSANAIIDYHCSSTYTVYAVGFTPGFAFLGEVDSRIAHPRKPTPRQQVLAGSVGIADTQTGIYPIDSPGGWNIIGRTPLNILDRNSKNICPINTGDKIQFYPIDNKTFHKLQGTLLAEFCNND